MGGLGLDMDDKDDVSFFFWSYSELQDALRLFRAAANNYVLYQRLFDIFQRRISMQHVTKSGVSLNKTL